MMSSELAAPGAEIKTIGRLTGDGHRARIRERSFEYSLRAIKLYQYLLKQKQNAGWVIARQFLRAACSVGANVEEAQAAESRADFVHKLGIAQKEARDSLYWLRLLGESQLVRRPRLGPLIQETEDLLRILASIILTTKQRPSGRGRSIPAIRNS
jgi:four helix bundle protein